MSMERRACSDSASGEIPAACPLCHEGRTGGGEGADGWWRCSRCGQAWTHTRLATVAAYATRERERIAGVPVAAHSGPRLVRARA